MNITTILLRFLLATALLGNANHINAAPIHVMALGDSITEGTPNQNYRLALGMQARMYGCDLVFNGTIKDTFPQFASSHYGIGGIQAQLVDAAFITSWMINEMPDVVLIHLGTNDAVVGRTALDTAKYLSSIIDKIRAINPAVKIFIAQLIPMAPSAPNATISQLNSLIPTLADMKKLATSPPVVAVDLASGFDLATDTSDGVHPTTVGNAKIATKWFEALVNANVCSNKEALVNAAQYKPIKSTLPGGNPEQAFDDNVQTGGWSSYTIDPTPQALAIDLGRNFAIRWIEINHYSIAANTTSPYNTRDYRIEVSNDASQWTVVSLLKGNDKGWTSHVLSGVEGRYVRLTIDSANWIGKNYNWVNIREFRVMGVAR